MATRDFTPEVLDIMENNLDTNAGTIGDFFEKIFSPKENVSLNEDMSNLEDYLSSCLEIEDIGHKQLKKIIEAVQTTEDLYKDKFITDGEGFDTTRRSCMKQFGDFSKTRRNYLEGINNEEMTLEQALSLIESPKSKEKIMELHPDVRMYFIGLILELEKFQKDNNLSGCFYINDAYRDYKGSASALASGNSKANPGESWHNYGMAVDIYYDPRDGSPMNEWPPIYNVPGLSINFLQELGLKYGTEYGGAWFGNTEQQFQKGADPPHFEFNGGIGNNNPRDYKWPPLHEGGTYQDAIFPEDFTIPELPPFSEFNN